MEALAKSVPLIADFLTSPQFWLILGIALVLAGPLGMIPGVGSLTIASILVPFAILNLDPVHGVMLVAAIISLANTMDSVPAILLGYVTAPTQVTFLEGHQLAQRGEAARALGAVYAVSTIGGVAGAIALALLLPVIRPFIIRFSFPEITAMALFGILMISVLSRGAFLRGLAGAMLGLVIATIGLSSFSAQPRFTFDILYLNGGLPIIPVVLGLFALPEVLDLTMTGKPVSAPGTKLSNRQIWEGIQYGLRRWRVAIRQGLFGVGLGVIPGVGSGVIDWLSYMLGIVFTKDRSQFGKGSLDGLLFAESAQNAQNSGQAVPTLGFGIPGSLPWAILLAVILGYGIAPGLPLLGEHLDITVGVVLSIGIGNVLMVILALAMTPLLLRLTQVPYPFIAATLFPLMLLAAYQSRFNMADIYVVLAMGALGLAMKWHGWPRPPFIIAFILGPVVEQNAWPALQMGDGVLIFLTRPFTLGILILGAAAISFLLWALRPQAESNIEQPIIAGGSDDERAQEARRTGVLAWLPSLSLNLRWQWEYLLWAILIGWVTVVVLREALGHVPSAAFVPMWATIAFLSLMALLAVLEFTTRRSALRIMDIGMRTGTDTAAVRRLLPLIGWLLGFIVAIGFIGFQASAILFPLFYLPIAMGLRGKGWIWVLVSMGMIAAVTLGLMENLLNVFWPKPFIRDWLFS
ncbi:MAG: tripartite tricarboxylate transporter permease [Chloroflexi bacterium]|nr:tripartite tricarboxylate transporter permease [Chloroflexota bacterium]MYK35405.1 tripartite tricarboxylate transporter permease [Chloroflexota bacterium]